MTAVLVTHDQQEASVRADVIGVMAAGRLQQWGDAETLYQRPVNPFVVGESLWASLDVHQPVVLPD
jgi:ABC-type sugar transport system ATPase subunit